MRPALSLAVLLATVSSLADARPVERAPAAPGKPADTSPPPPPSEDIVVFKKRYASTGPNSAVYARHPATAGGNPVDPDGAVVGADTNKASAAGPAKGDKVGSNGVTVASDGKGDKIGPQGVTVDPKPGKTSDGGGGIRVGVDGKAATQVRLFVRPGRPAQLCGAIPQRHANAPPRAAKPRRLAALAV